MRKENFIYIYIYFKLEINNNINFCYISLILQQAILYLIVHTCSQNKTKIEKKLKIDKRYLNITHLN